MKKRIIASILAAMASLALAAPAAATSPVPEELPAPPPPPEAPSYEYPPYVPSVHDEPDGTQSLYLVEPDGNAAPFLIATIDWDAWKAKDESGGRFLYDLDTGLLSEWYEKEEEIVETQHGPMGCVEAGYAPIMYVVDGEWYAIDELEARKTITPEYSCKISCVREKGKRICLRTVHFGGIEYLEKDKLSLSALRDVQDARRLAPGYGRLFPEGWSYEAKKGDEAAVLLDTAEKRITFVAKASMDEFPEQSLLRILKSAARLRDALSLPAVPEEPVPPVIEPIP